MKEAGSSSRNPEPRPPGKALTSRDVYEIMMFDGYSADQRQTWLKTALTFAAKRHEEQPTSETRQLVEEIEAVMKKNVERGESEPPEE